MYITAEAIYESTGCQKKSTNHKTDIVQNHKPVGFL